MSTATAPTIDYDQRMRAGYDALAKGDIDAMRNVFGAECVTHIPGRNPLGGDKLGFDPLMEYFGELVARTDGTFKIDLLQVLVNDTHGVGVHHETGRRGGKVLDTRCVVVVRWEGTLAAEMWVHYFDQNVADSFWS